MDSFYPPICTNLTLKFRDVSCLFVDKIFFVDKTKKGFQMKPFILVTRLRLELRTPTLKV